MTITSDFDTIAAIATPMGEGAIGIIRISGSDALAIIQKLFKGKNLEQAASHTINYGHIVENGQVIDEVMVSLCEHPRPLREKMWLRLTHTAVLL